MAGTLPRACPVLPGFPERETSWRRCARCCGCGTERDRPPTGSPGAYSMVTSSPKTNSLQNRPLPCGPRPEYGPRCGPLHSSRYNHTGPSASKSSKRTCRAWAAVARMVTRQTRLPSCVQAQVPPISAERDRVGPSHPGPCSTRILSSASGSSLGRVISAGKASRPRPAGPGFEDSVTAGSCRCSCPAPMWSGTSAANETSAKAPGMNRE